MILGEPHTAAYFQLPIFTPDSCQTFRFNQFQSGATCGVPAAEFLRKLNPRKIMAHHANSSQRSCHIETFPAHVSCQRLSGSQLEEGVWDRKLPTPQRICVEALKSWPTLNNAQGEDASPDARQDSSCSMPARLQVMPEITSSRNHSVNYVRYN